jgi:hypothetical protein
MEFFGRGLPPTFSKIIFRAYITGKKANFPENNVFQEHCMEAVIPYIKSLYLSFFNTKPCPFMNCRLTGI